MKSQQQKKMSHIDPDNVKFSKKDKAWLEGFIAGYDVGEILANKRSELLIVFLAKALKKLEPDITKNLKQDQG